MKMVGRKLASVAVAAALGGMAAGAVAGGFAIGTQSGSGTGNAFAGGAAAADDASVVWFNPAAMTLLPTGNNIAGALHVLKPSFKFTNSSSTGVFAGAGTGDGGDGGDWAYVPNAFYTTNFGPQWRFGVALNVPFGLKTEYDPGWRGRFAAILSEIKTVNINPSVAYKVSDTVSIGGGLSVQKIEAELSSLSATGAGTTTLNADDTGYGFNLGAVFQPAPSTRIGISYRSQIKYELTGDITFSAAPPGNGGVKADLKVPDSASFSVFHSLNPQWELMGDLTWTGWSSLQQLQVIRTTGAGAGTTLFTLPFNWDDTWRYSVGANYKMSSQTKLRVGVALDKTPTNDVDRTPRLPDQDRTWAAFGVQWRPSKAGILDFGYAHEFIKDASVNSPVTGATTCAAGCVTGKFKNKADIFSMQYSHSF